MVKIIFWKVEWLKRRRSWRENLGCEENKKNMGWLRMGLKVDWKNESISNCGSGTFEQRRLINWT